MDHQVSPNLSNADWRSGTELRPNRDTISKTKVTRVLGDLGFHPTHVEIAIQLVPDCFTTDNSCGSTSCRWKPPGTGVVSVGTLASSGTSLMPDVGSRYLLNRGPCWAVLPLVVDLATVDVDELFSDGDLRPKTNLLAPGKRCPAPFPLPLPLLLPPFPLIFLFLFHRPCCGSFHRIYQILGHQSCGRSGPRRPQDGSENPRDSASSLIFLRLSR